ncbi:MAG TPA: class I SAM-dependent methyltransferase [Myxococcota bacterium]
MKLGDRALQQWRMRKAARHVPRGARVLDIGAHEGELLALLGPRISRGVGIDPLSRERSGRHIELLRGEFPDQRVLARGPYDVVTLLAVFEHVPDPAGFARAVKSALVPGGRFILTVPDARVDRILDVLTKLGVVDGMSLEEHHGFDVGDVPRILASAGFRVLARERFQLGLNNLFVAVA